MTDKVVSKKKIKILSKVRELLNQLSDGDPDESKLKRERFLARLKSRYGYTNEKAVDEIEKLLKQFFRTNRSLGIRRVPQDNFIITP